MNGIFVLTRLETLDGECFDVHVEARRVASRLSRSFWSRAVTNS